MRKNRITTRVVTLAITASAIPHEGIISVHEATPPCLGECTGEDHYIYECEQFVQALENRWFTHPDILSFRQVIIQLGGPARVIGFAHAVRFNHRFNTIEMEMDLHAVQGDVSILSDWKVVPDDCVFEPAPSTWILPMENAT